MARTKATARPRPRPRWRVGAIQAPLRAAPPKHHSDKKGGHKGKKKARKDEAKKDDKKGGNKDKANNIFSRRWRFLRREPPGHRRYENVTLKGRFVFEMPYHPEGWEE